MKIIIEIRVMIEFENNRVTSLNKINLAILASLPGVCATNCVFVIYLNFRCKQCVSQIF